MAVQVAALAFVARDAVTGIKFKAGSDLHAAIIAGVASWLSSHRREFLWKTGCLPE